LWQSYIDPFRFDPSPEDEREKEIKNPPLSSGKIASSPIIVVLLSYVMPVFPFTVAADPRPTNSDKRGRWPEGEKYKREWISNNHRQSRLLKGVRSIVTM